MYVLTNNCCLHQFVLYATGRYAHHIYINCFLLPIKRRLLSPTAFSLECFKFLFSCLTAKFHCIQHSSRRSTWFRTVNTQDVLFTVLFVTTFSISSPFSQPFWPQRHIGMWSLKRNIPMSILFHLLGLFLKTQCPLKSSTAYLGLYSYIIIFLL